ncbi:UV DNA damage endonuclease [Bacillus mesophilus]|uniref:UV DNA damage endonuclease n=1 Tax=Bacillus mesophilus TaxID=1808955 RepID=A0A6M0QBQ2_9BACI|nr:UV DNA damage repair endonuclease UvsE [Bacillus mesophilus]MBM7662423.1 UV DNA damage endonuclease [Bacillus mesophilus]NEY72950.1 UV DNA damage repair endonuclease UvsE [Bacillus mesophilus]
MRIRFGYVSTALSLWDGSPSKTITFTNWKKLKKDERKTKLIEVAKQNIRNTKRALLYNIAHEIDLYRMSSSIVPLATHPEVKWNYAKDLEEDFKDLGETVNHYNLRVSLHPNQYTLFTSEREQVTLNAVEDMKYHYKIFKTMGVEKRGLINIHVGGAYGDKSEAIKRFNENIKLVPKPIKNRMTLENDDKTYTTTETLNVCKEHNIPVMFDYHHHMANLSEEPLDELLPAVFKTWDHFGLIPKVHISSPKSESKFRHHADFVSLEFIIPFLNLAKEIGTDFDIMIEAKEKDRALFKLVEEVSKIRGVKRINGGTVEW